MAFEGLTNRLFIIVLKMLFPQKDNYSLGESAETYELKIAKWKLTLNDNLHATTKISLSDPWFQNIIYGFKRNLIFCTLGSHSPQILNLLKKGFHRLKMDYKNDKRKGMFNKLWSKNR